MLLSPFKMYLVYVENQNTEITLLIPFKISEMKLLVLF